MEDQSVGNSAEDILAKRRMQNRIAQRKRRQRQVEIEKERNRKQGLQREEIQDHTCKSCIRCRPRKDNSHRRTNDEEYACSSINTTHLEEAREQEPLSPAETRSIDRGDLVRAQPEHYAQSSTTAESSKLLSDLKRITNENPEEAFTIDQYLNLGSPQFLQMHVDFVTPSSETNRPATSSDATDSMPMPPFVPWNTALDHSCQSLELPTLASHSTSRDPAASVQRPVSPPWSETHSRQHSINNISTQSLASGRGDEKVFSKINHDGDDEGKTALHICAARGSFRMVQLLLDHDIDVESTDSQGRTALHLAASRGHILVMKTLLKAGADPDVVDCHGMSPIHAAVDSECEGAISLLVREGADLNAPIKVDSRRAKEAGIGKS